MEPVEEVKASEKVDHEFKTTAQFYNALRYAGKFVIDKIGAADVAVVLGSGLGGLVNTLTDPLSMEYTEIPFMPMTSVVGHGKTLYNGTVGDKKVLLWSGRVHMYEGYSSHQLTFITYLSAFVGCKYIILTNSSGGGLEGMKTGSLMVSKDHLAFAGKCPIPAVFNDARFGERNLKSSVSHSKYLRELAKTVASENEIELFEGNYCWTTGPSYETPLEATMLRKFGGGCFGMSTVPEILSAGQIGLECVVLTMITNLAAGLQKALSHVEVHDEAVKAGPRLASLVSNIIHKIDMKRETSLALKDTISSESCLESYLMKNPKPQHDVKEWTAGALEMLDITNLGYSKAVEAYWFMSNGAHADILKHANLKDIRELPFNELPNFPLKSSAAVHSKIVFATTSQGKRVLLVLGSFIEGLLPSESFFLVHLLKGHGISMVKFIIEAATTNKKENLKEGWFVIASDYVNKSYFPPCDPNLDYYYPFKSVKRHLENEFSKVLRESLGDDVSGFDDVTVLLQDGPCYPTNANMDMYKHANQDLVTITNLSALDTANALGMLQTTFVAVRNQDYDTHENSKASEIAQLLFDHFSKHTIAEKFGYEHNAHEVCQNRRDFEALAKPLDVSGVEHIDVTLPFHSSVDALDSAVKTVEDFLQLDKSVSYTGVSISHFNYNQVAHQFKVKKAVRFVNEFKMNQALPELVYCTFADKEDAHLLVVKGMLVHQENLDCTARSMTTRIIHRLGVNRFTIIGSVFGAVDEMKVGDLIIPRDHLNLSVLNVTSGPNIDTWGMRFYDVSKCYADELIENFEAKAAEHDGVKVWKSNLFMINNGKTYAGLAEQQFCKGMGVINNYDTTGVTFEGHPEVMTIRHMDFASSLHAIYIGVIFDKCVRADEGTKLTTVDITEYSKGIDNAVTIFKETL